MPTAGVFMSKHVLNDRPSPGLAILWTSFEPRLDLLGTSFESSVHAACGTIFKLLPASLFKVATTEAWKKNCTVCFVSATSLSNVWLAARCFHPLHDMPAKYVLLENMDCYRLWMLCNDF